MAVEEHQNPEFLNNFDRMFEIELPLGMRGLNYDSEVSLLKRIHSILESFQISFSYFD